MTVVFFPDNNGNGIPDIWESQYGITNPNGDNDADGLPNKSEYIANTNPTNAASRLILISATLDASEHTTISWQSIGGTRYRVSYSDGIPNGLPSTPFVDIVRPVADEMDSAPVGTASTQTYTDNLPPTPNISRYFRIKVVQ